MPEATDSTDLSTCGCCESGLEEPLIFNPPGQPTLNYRIGQHSAFLRRMIARLGQQELPDGELAGSRPLAKLTARTPDDPAIAMLDAWATVAHVLAFYQERIATEGYLRTATERRSVLELARAIGYELAPGVAAQTFLAFTVDESDQTPDETTIFAGTQVQSIPTKEGELPQTFETAMDFEAKAWWNVLRPQLSQPQEVTLNSNQVFLQTTSLNLAAGDRMLLVGKDENGDPTVVRKRVRTLEVNRDLNYTLVAFEDEPNVVVTSALARSSAAAVGLQSAGYSINFSGSNVDALLSASLSEGRFQAILGMVGWSASDVMDYVTTKTVPTSVGDIEVYVLREKAAIFGHNSPHYSTLSTEAKAVFDDWDNPDWQVWHDSLNVLTYYVNADVYLERPIPGIVTQSWLLLERIGDYQVYQITGVSEQSIAGFGISAKAMALDLAKPDGTPLNSNLTDKDSSYKVRRTTGFVKSEQLQLAAVPVTSDLLAGDTELILNGLVPGLEIGQPVALTGEQADAAGVLRSEIKFLDTITHTDGFTALKFTEGLAFAYKRDTLIINANVASATHGETQLDEVLGSGDGAQPNQRFKLKKPPLTYVSAATASGAESTLTVRVNGVAWQQTPTLYGLNAKARNYVVRISDGADAYVVFGDGKSGGRLPTGQENVTATYRSGIGLAGEVGAGSLTLLKKRPFGVRSVINPTEASGAEDPETLDDARQNAPLTVLTLERIVSLQDYEDFARAFAGIGKANAVALWNGETEVVHVTVADANGGAVPTTSDLFKNLRDAINGARDPLRAVEIGSFQPRFFEMEAKVLVDPAYRWEDVKGSLEAMLKETFSFEQRAFGQPVTTAEIINVMHNVAGVTAVDLDELYVLDTAGLPAPPLLSSVLSAQTARPNPAPTAENPLRFLPAELLQINPAAITLTEMTTVS